MNRLSQLRSEQSLSQENIGKLLNVQKATVSKYENGKIPLTDELIIKFCNIFDCSADYLLGLSNTPSCKKCSHIMKQGDKIIQSAFAGTGLLSDDGLLPQGSEPIIRDFLANNAYMLKQLIENTANIR